MKIFWETTQRARKEHFCDYCGNWIQAGEEYSRKAWSTDRRRFVIMKQHACCPVNEWDPSMQHASMPQIRVALEVKEKLVLVQRLNGEVSVESQSVIESVLVDDDVAESPKSEDEEIIF